MADIAASVLARLKNKAAESGRSYQLCLQLFCQEEFLRRLEKSKYAENLVLKGGLFIYSLTDFDSRVTVDVDFLLRKISNTPEQLGAILEEIIATDTGNDFVYADDFADPVARYKEVTQQTIKSNPETMGRFHTNWLNMMYPRPRRKFQNRGDLQYSPYSTSHLHCIFHTLPAECWHMHLY